MARIPPIRGAWTHGSEAVVHVHGRRFVRSLGISHPGVRLHYREDVPSASRHLYVMSDGTWRVDHVDAVNPDYGLVAFIRHVWLDVL
jgi:hypothetical protein